MARYTKKGDNWKKLKALEFFANFVRNHGDGVEDNDTFELISGMISPDELRNRIRAAFPEKTFQRMVNWKDRRNRLDFDDESKEVIREAWSIPFARRRVSRMLAEIADGILADTPVDKYAKEPFARRAAELQKTLCLSNFELDVLLVLAFVHSNLLNIADGHCHRTDENDKAVFVAKCLDCDISEVLAALDEKGKLRRYNCVDDDIDFNCGLMGFLNGVRNEPLTSCYFHTCREEGLLDWTE